MYDHQSLTFNTPAKNNLNQIIIRERQVNQVITDIGSIPESTNSCIAVSTAIGLVIAFFLLLNTVRATQNILLNIQQSYRLPCRNCKYFSYNSYLQCALHPSIVSTPEAMNCSDYHNSNFSASELRESNEKKQR